MSDVAFVHERRINPEVGFVDFSGAHHTEGRPSPDEIGHGTINLLDGGRLVGSLVYSIFEESFALPRHFRGPYFSWVPCDPCRGEDCIDCDVFSQRPTVGWGEIAVLHTVWIAEDCRGRGLLHRMMDVYRRDVSRPTYVQFHNRTLQAAFDRHWA